MDKLIGLRAALAVLGSLHDKREVEYLMAQFVPWLENSHDDADKLVRRYVLMTVTEGYTAGAESDPVKLRKLVESVYSMR